MPSQKKGNFIIKHSEGSVTLGSATTMVNDTMSAGWNDATEIQTYRDASGVRRTITKDENVMRMNLRLTPGIGSALTDQAAVKACVASIRKGDAIVTTGFEDADLNWASGDKATIVDIGKTLQSGDIFSVDVVCEKVTTAEAVPVVIDFTGAWAAL